MVKVTFLNKITETTVEDVFIVFFSTENYYKFVSLDGRFIEYPVSSIEITKVEKRIGDLTLDECESLGISVDTFCALYLDGKEMHGEYDYNIYVDVTELYINNDK